MATRQAGSWAPNARSDAAVTWQGLNSDGTGVVFDGGDFSAGRFSSEIVLFTGAEPSGGMVSFSGVGRRSHPPVLAGAANRRQVWCCPFNRPRQGGADSNEADEREAEKRGSGTVARRPLSSGTIFTTAASLRKDRPGKPSWEPYWLPTATVAQLYPATPNLETPGQMAHPATSATTQRPCEIA